MVTLAKRGSLYVSPYQPLSYGANLVRFPVSVIASTIGIGTNGLALSHIFDMRILLQVIGPLSVKEFQQTCFDSEGGPLMAVTEWS